LSDTHFGLVLERARALGRAVGAFTCYDLFGLEAVLSAAEARHAPVIVLVSPGSFAGAAGDRLGRALAVAAEDSAIDALVQLDHTSDVEAIARAAAGGLHAVMADGSRLPDPENLDLVHAAWAELDGSGAGVEAELGRVEGDEDRAAATVAGGLTDPAAAREFAAESGVDCLAVSVGNVHGHYEGTPQLDWPLLERLAAEVPVPLALHGASGLPDADVRRAVALGVAKVNVNTELRAAYFARLRGGLFQAEATLDLKGLGEDVVAGVREVVEAKLALIGWEAA
jgi:tagatose 1,6-diphosphate aldolase GatY/KbaY